MSDIESARAAREARASSVERASSGHTTDELADRAIRRYLRAEELLLRAAEKEKTTKEKAEKETGDQE
ncbi:hypothetical protein [Amycolatopsis alkalitolerans]|uniref:Uncharacterized protein n=1 Tax=Amycolatopsis alkalitolerans TaxID=2547244 RepID=A0A5C4M034_9PSEU|nr:hypothetical protein [Amycolatopsis alkalitolerans]TNC24820.1 hypothetical protein FG385_16360 [Amycolatopsis alkalitolerans]